MDNNNTQNNSSTTMTTLQIKRGGGGGKEEFRNDRRLSWCSDNICALCFPLYVYISPPPLFQSQSYTVHSITIDSQFYCFLDFM